LLQQNVPENGSFPSAAGCHPAFSQNGFGNLPLFPAFLQG